MRLLPLLLLLPGCLETRPGTAVGNPGKLEMSATDVPEQVALRRADLERPEIGLFGCPDGAASRRVDAVVDLLEPGQQAVTIPGGQWCSLTVAPRGALILEGETAGGTTFDLALAPFFDLTGEFEVDGNQLLLDLSLAALLDPEELEALGDEVVVEPGDALADEFAMLAEDDARLFDDENEDGAAQADEPEVATPLASPPDSSASAACACDSASPGAGWAWLLLAWLLARRRR